VRGGLKGNQEAGEIARGSEKGGGGKRALYYRVTAHSLASMSCGPMKKNFNPGRRNQQRQIEAGPAFDTRLSLAAPVTCLQQGGGVFERERTREKEMNGGKEMT